MSKWKQRGPGEVGVVDETGKMVAAATDAEAARKIVREHNAHAALVSACKSLLTCSLPNDVSGRRMCDAARAAINLAEGKNA